MTLTAPPAIAADLPNPLALWHLDSIDGNTTPDASGNGYTGNVLNMELVPGRFGNAVKHITTDVGNVRVHPGGLDEQTVTVSAWIRGDGSLPGTTDYVVAQGADGCVAQWALFPGAQRSMSFYVTNDSGTTYSQNAPRSVWDGQWHMVTGTYDGMYVRLYVDGQQVPGAPGVTDLGIGNAPNRDLTIGNFPDEICGGTQSEAAIDEVQVFDTALSADQVAELYSPSPTPTPSPTPSTPTPTPTQPGPSAQPTFSTFTKPGLTLLRANQQATRYDWDLNADRVPDVRCPADSPVLGVNLGRTQAATVALLGASVQSVQFTRARAGAAQEGEQEAGPVGVLRRRWTGHGRGAVAAGLPDQRGSGGHRSAGVLATRRHHERPSTRRADPHRPTDRRLPIHPANRRVDPVRLPGW